MMNFSGTCYSYTYIRLNLFNDFIVLKLVMVFIVDGSTLDPRQASCGFIQAVSGPQTLQDFTTITIPGCVPGILQPPVVQKMLLLY